MSLWQQMFQTLSRFAAGEILVPKDPRIAVRLFSFTTEQALEQWEVVTDSIYGGHSTASFTFDPRWNCCRFEGTVDFTPPDARFERLGYASIRSIEKDFVGLSPFDHLVLRMRSESKSNRITTNLFRPPESRGLEHKTTTYQYNFDVPHVDADGVHFPQNSLLEKRTNLAGSIIPPAAFVEQRDAKHASPKAANGDAELFVTEDDPTAVGWVDVVVPFSRFVATRNGEIIQTASVGIPSDYLDLLRRVGFLAMDEEGRFSFLLHSVTAINKNEIIAQYGRFERDLVRHAVDTLAQLNLY